MKQQTQLNHFYTGFWPKYISRDDLPMVLVMFFHSRYRGIIKPNKTFEPLPQLIESYFLRNSIKYDSIEAKEYLLGLTTHFSIECH